jgi:hypothetical protein
MALMLESQTEDGAATVKAVRVNVEHSDHGYPAPSR